MSREPLPSDDSEDIPSPPADPRLTASGELIGRLLTTEEIELLQLRDVAYGGSWVGLAKAIRYNASLPEAVRLASLQRIAFLKAYEENNSLMLRARPGRPTAGSSGTGDRTT